jgi:hypothetical protein
MFEDDDGGRQTSSLRGRLSDVFFPALLSDSQEELGKRLGSRAKIYAPIVGAAAGAVEVSRRLKELAAWLSDHSAAFSAASTVVGVDRDVTEGTLSMRVNEQHIELPVALIMERRKAREVDLRIYHATLPLKCSQAARPARGPSEKDPAVPAHVAEHLALIRLGDVDALVAGFETDGSVRDGTGKVHARTSGSMHAFYVKLLQSGPAANDWQPVVISVVDDGRTCAVEYETSKLRGGEIAPKEGAMIFERGANGLLTSVRIYDEAE